MVNALIMTYGLIAVVGLFVLYDWLARRKHRRAQQHTSKPF